MYKRVVGLVAVALFSLLALVAAIVTDLHDRDFPQALGAQSRLGLGFGDSRFTDREALAELSQLDAELGLGLVKIAPDLVGDSDERLFVALNDGDLPTTFDWFSGSSTGEVVGKDRLDNSPADGSYLVTGDVDRLAELESRLGTEGVRVTRTDASVTDSLRFTMGEGGFMAAVLAAFSLIAALALFWLSMKARSRALRVLGGSRAVRVQAQDLGGFAAVLLLSAAVVTLAGAGWTALSRGPLYVETFSRALIALQLAVIAASLLTALAMSALAWPSISTLATRQPAVKSLRSVAVVVQASAFLLVVSAAAPAWSAYRSSATTAAEMAQWTNLADQVAVQFGMSDEEMSLVEPEFGKLAADAEEAGALAYSYTFMHEQWGGDFDGYSGITLVNQQWLDLMTADAPPAALRSVPYDRVRRMLTRELGSTLTLLSRDGAADEQLLAGLRYSESADGFRVPVGEGGSGGLQFLDDVLVAVVPSVHSVVNDRNLTSMASTRNIVFTGVAATQQLLDRHGLGAEALDRRGLEGDLSIVYVAEEGILRAQFTAYVVWLMTLALAALAVAFAVAAGISALITSLMHAKRDFPLRLSGHSWPVILQNRVARQLSAGAALVAVVAVLQRPDEMGPVLLAAAFGLVVVPICHLCAAQWCFSSVTKRRT